jgi:hypothetical protein
MAQTKKVLPEGLKVTFEAITGWVRGRGLFGIEEEEDEVARQAKLQWIAERRSTISTFASSPSGQNEPFSSLIIPPAIASECFLNKNCPSFFLPRHFGLG